MNELEIKEILAESLGKKEAKSITFPVFSTEMSLHILLVDQIENGKIIRQVAYAIDKGFLPSFSVGEGWETQELNPRVGGYIKKITTETRVRNNGKQLIFLTRLSVE